MRIQLQCFDENPALAAAVWCGWACTQLTRDLVKKIDVCGNTECMFLWTEAERV